MGPLQLRELGSFESFVIIHQKADDTKFDFAIAALNENDVSSALVFPDRLCVFDMHQGLSKCILPPPPSTLSYIVSPFITLRPTQLVTCFEYEIHFIYSVQISGFLSGAFLQSLMLVLLSCIFILIGSACFVRLLRQSEHLISAASAACRACLELETQLLCFNDVGNLIALFNRLPFKLERVLMSYSLIFSRRIDACVHLKLRCTV